MDVRTLVSDIDWGTLVTSIKSFGDAFSKVDWKTIGESLVTITNALINTDWGKVGATLVGISIDPYQVFIQYAIEFVASLFTIEQDISSTNDRIAKDNEAFSRLYQDQWSNLALTLTGHSIIPDMMSDIYDEITGKMTDINVNLATSINGAGGIVAKFTDLAEGIKPAVTWTNNLYGALDRLAKIGRAHV